MINKTTLKLNTGAEIPQLGLGTWQSSTSQAYDAVLAALKAGYRHIDTAAIYKNEVEVGRAIRDSGIPREEIFITTKLFGVQYREPDVGLADSLERLGLDYVDLYLMHWPVPLKPKPGSTKMDRLQVLFNDDGTRQLDIDDWDFIKTYALMQDLVKSGKTKAIGVSNFSINNLKQLLDAETTTITPAANQCECHPLLPQTELIEFCKSKGILFEAYSPLGSTDSPLFTNTTLKSIADKYGVSIPQILINWAFKRGYVVLPKSTNPDRIVKNGEVLDWSDEDFNKVTDLVKVEGEQRMIKPNWEPFPIFE